MEAELDFINSKNGFKFSNIRTGRIKAFKYAGEKVDCLFP